MPNIITRIVQPQRMVLIRSSGARLLGRQRESESGTNIQRYRGEGRERGWKETQKVEA